MSPGAGIPNASRSRPLDPPSSATDTMAVTSAGVAPHAPRGWPPGRGRRRGRRRGPWLALPCLSAAGFGVFAWCVTRRTGPALSAVLAVLVTLLFYQFALVRYQIVLFCLVSYWALSEWEELKRHTFLTTLLVGYFGWLALWDVIWLEPRYGRLDFLITIALGFVLLAGLIQFSIRPPTASTSFAAR